MTQPHEYTVTEPPTSEAVLEHVFRAMPSQVARLTIRAAGENAEDADEPGELVEFRISETPHPTETGMSLGGLILRMDDIALDPEDRRTIDVHTSSQPDQPASAVITYW